MMKNLRVTLYPQEKLFVTIDISVLWNSLSLKSMLILIIPSCLSSRHITTYVDVKLILQHWVRNHLNLFLPLSENMLDNIGQSNHKAPT